MTKYQQIKEYVDDHVKYYAFYPFDIVLNMDTEQEETLTYDEYWHILKNKSTYDVTVWLLSQWWLLSCMTAL